MRSKEPRDVDQEQQELADINSGMLDKMKEVMQLKNDAALARAMDLAPPVVSKLRNGVLPFGSNYVIRAHELTGLPVREIKDCLGQKSLERHQVAA